MVHDKILSVNGTSLLNLPHKDVIKLLVDSGAAPELVIRREDDGDNFIESQAYASFAARAAAEEAQNKAVMAGANDALAELKARTRDDDQGRGDDIRMREGGE
jgi:uncharacterized protein (DUF2336 family)